MESPFLHHASFSGSGRGGMNINNNNNRGNFEPRGRRGFGPPRGARNFVQPPMAPHFHQQWSGTDVRPHQGFSTGPDGPVSYGNQARRPQPNMIWSDPSFFQPRPFGPHGTYQGGPPGMPVPYGGESPKGSGSDGGGYGRGGFGRGRGNRYHSQHGMQSRQQNNFQSQKKKVDKRDLPENNKFHCEVCDRGFKNEVEYENHNAQHQQCSVKGCRYVAVPKLLQLHYQTQHRTGVAKEIWSIESPEEIEKWKQERRKHFPTRENILKKEQLASEKRERGEVVETKQFGKFRNQGYKRGRGNHRNRGHQDRRSFSHQAGFRGQTGDVASGKPENMAGDGHKRHLSPEPPEEKTRVASDTTSSPQSKNQQVSSVPDAADEPVGLTEDPLSLLIAGKSDNETDDSDVPAETSVRPEQMGQSGLANLMSSYQSDDEDNSKNAADTAAAAGKGAEQPVTKKEEVTEIATASIQPTITRQTYKRSHSTSASNKGRQPNKKKKTFHKPTLLEKLLKNDIRHERNLILQCVYFIVKNRFLDVCDGK